MQELVKYREKMQEVQENATQNMEADWDERAREDASLYIIVTDNPQDYYWTGLKDTYDILLPVYDKLEARGAVLDVGCGAGRTLQHMGEMFDYFTGVDVSGEMLKLAEVSCPGATLVKIDGLSLPIHSDYFDFIYSIYVFDHIPKKAWCRSLVKDIYRVLKPGGYVRLVIAVHPKSEDDRNTWSGALWTLAEWDECIAGAGFVEIKHDTAADRKSEAIDIKQEMVYTTARK